MPSPNQPEHRPSLEIRIPISPKEFFFHRIHYLAASFAEFAGAYHDARITVVIGEDCDPFDVRERLSWSRGYPIEWRWVPRELFRRDSYFATRLYRYCLPVSTDVVLMLDSDTLCAGSLDELIGRVDAEKRIYGVTANVSPVGDDFSWEQLFDLADLGPVPYVAEHSGFGCTFFDSARRYSPPYFNFGVLPLPAEHCQVIGETVFDEMRVVRQIENFFVGQMSTTLAIVRNQLPWGSMPFRYNFVNDERYLPRFRADFEDLRILHFLNSKTIHKDRVFDSLDTVAAVLEEFRALEVDRRFVELLKGVHQRVAADAGDHDRPDP